MGGHEDSLGRWCPQAVREGAVRAGEGWHFLLLCDTSGAPPWCLPRVPWRWFKPCA